MNDEPATVRALAETVAEPWLVWTDEPIDLLDRVFWRYDRRNVQISVRWLNGDRMRTRTGVWDELQAALQFPHWFGQNWDAVLDCLAETEWEPRRSYQLVVTHAQSLMADEPADALDHLLGIFRSAAARLSEEYQQSFDERRPPTPFHVLFHVPTDAAAAWTTRMSTLEHPVPTLPLRDTRSWT